MRLYGRGQRGETGEAPDGQASDGHAPCCRPASGRRMRRIYDRPPPLPGPNRGCFWAERAGVGGVTIEDTEVRSWAQRVAGVRGCEVKEVRETGNTCDVVS